MRKNYEVRVSIQCDGDLEALQITASLAKTANEIAYLFHGGKSLCFFTYDGDFSGPLFATPPYSEKPIGTTPNENLRDDQ